MNKILIKSGDVTLRVASLGPFTNKDMFCTVELVTSDGITTSATNVLRFPGSRTLTVYSPYGLTIDKYFLKEYGAAIYINILKTILITFMIWRNLSGIPFLFRTIWKLDL